MKYDNEFIKRIADTVISGRSSIRQVSKLLGVSRNTVSRWINRIKKGLPARFKRKAKNVWNRTSEKILEKLKEILESGKSVVQTWVDLSKKVSMRTIQRWRAAWFPKVEERKECKRYVRRKAFSLMHTDWGVKRILNGRRMCFTFYEDDASRRLYALKAYGRANQENTNDNLRQAKGETNGFKAVLSDCGRVYTKSYGEECKEIGIKSIHTRPYNPKCNGKAEAVVKKVKKFLNKHIVRDIDHANELLEQFQEEYNNTPHSSLKYQTPLEVFRDKQRTGYIWAVT